MLSERDYQDLLDRMQALRTQVSERLSGSLVSNPALAEEINGQIEDLVEAATRRGRRRAPMPPDRGLAELVGSARRPPRRSGDPQDPAGRRALRRERQLRARRRGRRSLLHLPARTDRRVPRRPEAQGAVRGRRGPAVGGAGRLQALPVRPPRRAALHAATTGWPPTAGCSATAAALGAGQSRPNTDFHMLFVALRQPGHPVLARQADLAT